MFKRNTKDTAVNDAWLIFGLGNPGPKYARTRHNVGQMAVATIARRFGLQLSRHKAGADVATSQRLAESGTVILATSHGFMNTSGKPVAALARFYKVAPERIIIMHDDLDLAFDTIKLKQGGGHGGHNGLRDIISVLGSPDFNRVRIGIGRPNGSQDAVDFVLQPFTALESQTLEVLLEDAADAAQAIITEGLLAAQQQFHGRDKQ